MNSYTHPTTAAEEEAAHQWRLQNSLGYALAVSGFEHLRLPLLDDGPNPDEFGIDWLAINRDFS